MRYAVLAAAALLAVQPALAAAPTGSGSGTTPAAPTTAGAFKMQPGLWETTIRMQLANLPRLQTERVYRRCIMQTDIDKNDITPQTVTRADLSCTPKDFKRSGNSATYTLICTGQAGKTTAAGKMTFTSATAYDATIHTTGQINGASIDTTRTVHAERVGDCSSHTDMPTAGTSGG